MSRIGPMTIHTLFCSDCGGWESPIFQQINKHEGFIVCGTCGLIIVLVQTVEEVVFQS
jgi:hypothetical protein